MAEDLQTGSGLKAQSYPSLVRSQMFAGGPTGFNGDEPPKKIPAREAAFSEHVPAQAVKPRMFPTTNRLVPADRFIPSRRNVDVDMSNYLMTKKPTKNVKENQLDVFGQLKTLDTDWQKKLMNRQFERENIVKRQRKVLQFSQSSAECGKMAGSLIGKPAEFRDDGNHENSLWKAKPRRRPLLGIPHSVLELPDLRAVPGRHFVDWSSTNFIAAVLSNSVTLYDNQSPLCVDVHVLINKDNICSIKWNHAGDKLAATTLDSDISLHDVEKKKLRWKTSCRCVAEKITCVISCICWSQDDQRIITGCKGFISVYSTSDGERLTTISAHSVDILTISLSPNNSYLLTTATDMTVHIYKWPQLRPFLEINYYEQVKAVAWHPHKSSLLCIGGGLGDASLSLWNVNTQEPLSYRRVQFFGCVENLAWNKHSGELVVHWSYWKGRKLCTTIPILASLDRVVDVLRTDNDWSVNQLLWNSDETQIATQTGDSLYIWNFFGDETNYFKAVKDTATDGTRDLSDPSKAFKFYSIR